LVNQYSAADLVNVPRSYNDSGEASVGASGTAPGFFSFEGGLRSDGSKIKSVVNSTYPHSTGSYLAGEYIPTSKGPVSGVYAPGSGVNTVDDVRVVYVDGSNVRYVKWPGYMDGKPLQTSGINLSNLTITQYKNPDGVDPFLQSSV
jgi:hypothetical protein